MFELNSVFTSKMP